MGGSVALLQAGRTVLTREHRLTASAVFGQAVRRGSRAGGPRLVVHLTAPESVRDSRVPAQVGFVVSRAVGPAVTRNLVKRRLRHLVRDRIDLLPPGSVLVVRALPAAAGASYGVLGDDLDAQLSRAQRRTTGKAAS